MMDSLRRNIYIYRVIIYIILANIFKFIYNKYISGFLDEFKLYK